MTRFKCDGCGEVFVYAAKKTIAIPEIVGLTVKRGKKEMTLPETVQTIHSTEIHVCPFCQSLNFTEYTEPQQEIVSIKSVDINEADDWIAKGYKVLTHYAKTVTIADYSYVESKAVVAKSEDKQNLKEVS